MRHFVIYFNPTDYPKKWVVREFFIGVGEVRAAIKPWHVGDSKAAAHWFACFGPLRLWADAGVEYARVQRQEASKGK